MSWHEKIRSRKILRLIQTAHFHIFLLRVLSKEKNDFIMIWYWYECSICLRTDLSIASSWLDWLIDSVRGWLDITLVDWPQHELRLLEVTPWFDSLRQVLFCSWSVCRLPSWFPSHLVSEFTSALVHQRFKLHDIFDSFKNFARLPSKKRASRFGPAASARATSWNAWTTPGHGRWRF